MDGIYIYGFVQWICFLCMCINVYIYGFNNGLYIYIYRRNRQAEQPGASDADFLAARGIGWGTVAHVELTCSQVKHNSACMLAPIKAGERRQDSALCLTGDLARHCEQAASEQACCCKCWTCFEIGESIMVGYCPYLRPLLLPFVLLYCLFKWLAVKVVMLKKGSKALTEGFGWGSRGSASSTAPPGSQSVSQMSDPLLSAEPASQA